MIDYRTVQGRLGVKQDGQFGPLSYSALLRHIADQEVLNGPAFGVALSINDDAFGLTTPRRLAGFLGQCCHESSGFRQLREKWGPTPDQCRYEGRVDLGNCEKDDGFRYRGRGLIQLTGRANYDRVGRELGIDLIAHPEFAEQPATAVLTAMVFWQRAKLNDLADVADWKRMTRVINGGYNGLAERLACIGRGLEMLQ